METFLKKNIKLKENINNIVTLGYIKNKIIEEINNRNTYVQSSNNSMSSLGSDLNKSKSDNPMDNNFVVDLSSYDNNNTNDEATLEIDAKNGTDAQRKIQNTLASNPQLKTMANDNKLNAKVRLTTEQRKQGKAITKKEFETLYK